MRELAGHYGGPWTEIRERMTDPSRVNYTWFTHHVVDGPWHRGRVVLAGDAAHSCPPTLAQGARAGPRGRHRPRRASSSPAHRRRDRAGRAYTARRQPRAGAVVENSVSSPSGCSPTSRPPQAGGTADVPGLMARTSALLSQRP